jgi:hypothetical protein
MKSNFQLTFRINNKLKEEISSNEMANCTFKPAINTDYVSTRKSLEEDGRKDRFNKLFHQGTQIISSKKDRAKEDIDLEKNQSECTFKPQLSQVKVEDDRKIKNDIYKEKSYELLYSRLANGRIERFIKDSVHSRGDFPDGMSKYCKFF